MPLRLAIRKEPVLLTLTSCVEQLIVDSISVHAFHSPASFHSQLATRKKKALRTRSTLNLNCNFSFELRGSITTLQLSKQLIVEQFEKLAGGSRKNPALVGIEVTASDLRELLCSRYAS